VLREHVENSNSHAPAADTKEKSSSGPQMWNSPSLTAGILPNSNTFKWFAYYQEDIQKKGFLIIIFIFFFSLFIYLYVFTLLGPFLPPTPHTHPLPPHPTWLPGCPFLQFCWREDISNNKKDIAFLLVEIRIAIQRDS
jgi:hypothetical protein